MSSTDAWLRLVLAILATWRVTHLLAFEDGPWDILARVRMRLGEGFFGRLLDCFYCLSLWVAASIISLLRPQLAEWPLWWLACSGAACLLERLGPQATVTEHQPHPQDDPDRFVPVDRLNQEDARTQGGTDGMLRTTPGERERSSDDDTRTAGPS
jgi:hypothetical protein